MDISVAIKLLTSLISFLFLKHKENELAYDMISARVALEMEIEHIFREKHMTCNNKKKQLDVKVNDETILSVKEIFRTEYLLYIVDQAISSPCSRFEQF